MRRGSAHLLSHSVTRDDVSTARLLLDIVSGIIGLGALAIVLVVAFAPWFH